MIKKDELVNGLHELIRIEEGVITLHINFSKVLLKHAKGIEQDMKDKIEESLSRLYRETVGHKKIIDNLVKEIRISHRNEY